MLSITTRRLSPALGHGRGLHEHYRCRKRDPDECLSRGPHKADGACGSVQKENARPWPHPVLYQPYLRLQRLSTSESGACASASHVSRVRSGVTRFPVACKFLRSTMSIFSRMILGVFTWLLSSQQHGRYQAHLHAQRPRRELQARYMVRHATAGAASLTDGEQGVVAQPSCGHRHARDCIRAQGNTVSIAAVPAAAIPPQHAEP